MKQPSSGFFWLKFIIFFWASMCLVSCSSKNSFQSFYNANKSEADWALAFPKYVAMIAVPNESKREIKRFSEGMRKIRVLVDENNDDRLIRSFSSFAEGKNYTPYFVVKKDGSEMNLFAREEEGYIREIVLDIKDDEGSVIIGLIGKMDQEIFRKALQRASEE